MSKNCKENTLISDTYNKVLTNENTSEFVGSIVPEQPVHKILLTSDGSIVLVINFSGQLVGHVYSHPDGQMIKKIKLNPQDIGE